MPGTPQCYTAQGGQEEPAAEPRKLPARKGETRRGRSPMCFKRGGGCRLWRRCSGTQSWGLATVREAGRPGCRSLLFHEFCGDRSRKMGSNRASMGAREFIFK